MIVYLKRQMNWLFSFIAKIDFNLSAFKLKIQQSLPEAEHIPGREVQELPSQRLIFQMCLSIKSFPFAMTKSHYHTHPRSYKWWLRSTETSNVVTREPALDSKASKSNLHHELVPETHSTQPTVSFVTASLNCPLYSWVLNTNTSGGTACWCAYRKVEENTQVDIHVKLLLDTCRDTQESMIHCKKSLLLL